jgi:hypothetical protein
MLTKTSRTVEDEEYVCDVCGQQEDVQLAQRTGSIVVLDHREGVHAHKACLLKLVQDYKAAHANEAA